MHRLPEDVGEKHYHAVARTKAIIVVKGLEVVEIEIAEGQSRAAGAQSVLAVFGDPHVAGQPSQGILVAGLGQFALGYEGEQFSRRQKAAYFPRLVMTTPPLSGEAP